MPLALPNVWADRQLTNTDYGIDLGCGLFDGGRPSGRYLLFQIKGKADPAVTMEGEVHYDLKTSTLAYSELFVVPVLQALRLNY